MKKSYLYKTLYASCLGISLIFGGCGKKENSEPVEYTTLEGRVFGEVYMPATGAASQMFGGHDSRYSFSMNTKSGKKAVQVEDVYEITREDVGVLKKPRVKVIKDIKKESIDALIEPGTLVEIEIEKDKIDHQVYIVPADKIEIQEER